MSASREKKQRQGGGPDPKTIKAQKEQADRRRKNIIYGVAAAVVAVAVAALLIWNSGFFQRRMTAGTVGGEKMSVGDLSYCYYSARTNYLEELYRMYAQIGINPTFPNDTDVYDQESGKTYHDFYMDTALENASFVTALYNEALEKGYSLSDVKDDVDAAMQEIRESASSNGTSYGSYLRAVYGPYITNPVLKTQVERTALANKYYADHQQELLDAYTQEDFDAYLAEHHDDLDTFEYTVFYVAAPTVETTDKDGNAIDEETVNKQKEEAMEQAGTDAEAILTDYTTGSEFDHIVEEYGLTESSCLDHASRVGSALSNMAYYDDLLTLKDGEGAVVESTSGYYVVVLHSRALDTSSTRNVRHILINAETTTDEDGSTAAPTEEAWNAALAEIQAVKAEFDAGDRSESSFAALANEYSDDTGSNGSAVDRGYSEGGLYENVQKGQMVAEFNDWLFDDARQPGDVSDPIAHGKDDESSNYYGYHLIYYVGESGETVWANSAKSALIGADMDAWRADMISGYPAVINNSNAKLIG